jgi:hypothetical protein
VIVRDTGFQLPAGHGIVSFSNVDEAAAAIREVEGDYSRHATAARALAGEYFDSDKVLNHLVARAMTSSVERSSVVA